MKEGVNQGCPLSPIFATLVLHKALTPIDKSLRRRAREQLTEGNTVDDNHRGISHLFAYMDDISATIPLDDIYFFATKYKNQDQKLDALLTHTKHAFSHPATAIASCHN